MQKHPHVRKQGCYCKGTELSPDSSSVKVILEFLKYRLFGNSVAFKVVALG